MDVGNLGTVWIKPQALTSGESSWLEARRLKMMVKVRISNDAKRIYTIEARAASDNCLICLPVV